MKSPLPPLPLHLNCQGNVCLHSKHFEKLEPKNRSFFLFFFFWYIDWTTRRVASRQFVRRRRRTMFSINSAPNRRIFFVHVCHLTNNEYILPTKRNLLRSSRHRHLNFHKQCSRIPPVTARLLRPAAPPTASLCLSVTSIIRRT